MSDNRTTDLGHLGFRKYMPAPPLASYIDCYWFVDARCEFGSVFSEFLHPDGGMGFIFNCGDTLNFDGELLRQGVFLNGPYNRSMRLMMTERINAVGIRFKPAGAYHFMAVPLSEIKNSFIPCEDKNLCDLNDYFYDKNNDLDKVHEINSVMLKLFCFKTRASFFAPNAMSIVNQHKGMLEINKLISLLGVNQRKLERVFNAQVGVSPAEYSRAIRIASARTRLKDCSYRLSDIGLDLGFYDQAHFSGQFKSVVGIAPGEYRRRSQWRKLSGASN